jgi:glycosyltransferase involved in cell wall biosynthesis
MRPIRILVDSLADQGLLNAQMGNAREIICRLDPDVFHISTFVLGKPDPQVAARKNTRLIQLPQRRQTVRILSEFLLGTHQLLFYMKSSPSSRWYLALRKKWRDRRLTVGTVESQCNLRALEDLAPEARRLWEQTILNCDHLYSNSAYVQRSLLDEYGVHSEIIATGADTQFYTPNWERSRNTRPIVLFVGSLRSRKHPELMLVAASRFPYADFRLVGDGPMRPDLETEIERQGLRNVTLPGPLGAEELREEYRRADVFFFPSTFEGSPKVIVEAAACGLPVICRDCYSAETVIHGQTGFQARSEEELYSYLKVLLDTEQLRREMGRAGRRHSQKFDWDPITQEWASTFVELAGVQTLRYAS